MPRKPKYSNYFEEGTKLEEKEKDINQKLDELNGHCTKETYEAVSKGVPDGADDLVYDEVRKKTEPMESEVDSNLRVIMDRINKL